MNISQEINAVKKEIRILNSKIKRIISAQEKLKKMLSKKDSPSQKRKTKRKISYISWLDNERRMKNLISPY